jgi:hypothetical protein
MHAGDGQQFLADPYFENLGRLIFLPDVKERLMCMLGAYFDDSGTHAASPIVAVAGHVGKAEQWDRFNVEWTDALNWFNRRCGFNVTHFRMSAFMYRSGQFKGMTDTQAEILLDKLITFINLRSPYRVWCSMSKRDYDEVIGDRYSEICGSPFTICAQICILAARRWVEAHADNEPVAFIFEDGTLHKGEVLDAFDKAKKTRELDGLFADDTLAFSPKNRPPLQAADLLAWGARRLVRKGTSHTSVPHHRCFSKLLNQGCEPIYWNRTHLEKLLAIAKANKEKGKSDTSSLL